jgi:hypothetical protein
MNVAIALFIAWSASAPDPNAVLSRVDAAASRAKDATLTLDISVSAPGSEPLARTVKIWQQGSERRLVKFTAPAKLRGTGVLTVDGETYVYLPAYEKVRRVVGQSGGGSFLGTGFSVRDLGRTQFSKDYVPSLVSEPAGHVVLKLVPKDKDAHDHAWLIVSVRSADDLVDRIDTVDASGAITRTLVASEFETVDGYMVSRSVVIDEIDGQRRTSGRLTSADFDSGLSADAFTERELRRPP